MRQRYHDPKLSCRSKGAHLPVKDDVGCIHAIECDLVIAYGVLQVVVVGYGQDRGSLQHFDVLEQIIRAVDHLCQRL